MRFLTVLAAALSVSLASAQIFTSVLPFEDGDTLIVSRTVDAVGEFTYATISTFGGAAGVVAPATTTTRRATATGTAKTTAKTSAAVTTGAVAVPEGSPSAGKILGYSEYASAVAPSLSAQYEATVSAKSSGYTSSAPSLLLVSSVGVALVGTLFGAAGVLL